MGLRHLPLAFAGSGLFRTQGSRQNGPLAWGRLSLTLAIVGPARHWLGGAVPPVSGFGRFRHSGVSGNAHKPLNFQEETHHG